MKWISLSHNKNAAARQAQALNKNNTLKPGANPTIVSYNVTSSLMRFEKNIFPYVGRYFRKRSTTLPL
jgi:hypothetical protein